MTGARPVSVTVWSTASVGRSLCLLFQDMTPPPPPDVGQPQVVLTPSATSTLSPGPSVG